MQKSIVMAFLLVILTACAQSRADQLNSFTSDGCSSFPDGTFKQKDLWLNCCLAHDKAYWKGGDYQQRKQADEALKVCVEQTGEKEIAILMRSGVRVGGSPFWPTSYRWGYGWVPNRGYAALTPEEIILATKLLNQYEQQQLETKAAEK